MTVSERSPWQTVAARQELKDHYSANAHVDGYRRIEVPSAVQSAGSDDSGDDGLDDGNSKLIMQEATRNSTVHTATAMATVTLFDEIPTAPAVVTGAAVSSLEYKTAFLWLGATCCAVLWEAVVAW